MKAKLPLSVFLYKKCFDSISHSVLLSKLDKYGVRSIKLSWFNPYLVGRIQATCVHNNLSSFLTVKCGVPQGSILGSLLIIILINDLPKYVQSCNLYTDDTMIEKSGNNCLTGSTLTNSQSAMINLAVCLLVLLNVIRNLRIASTLDLLFLAAS